MQPKRHLDPISFLNFSNPMRLKWILDHQFEIFLKCQNSEVWSKVGILEEKISEIVKIIRNCELYNSFSIEFNGFLLFLTAWYSMTLSEFGWWRIKKWRFVRNYKLIEKWNFYQGSFQNFLLLHFKWLNISHFSDTNEFWIKHLDIGVNFRFLNCYFKPSKM